MCGQTPDCQTEPWKTASYRDTTSNSDFLQETEKERKEKKKDENENTMPITLYNMVGTLPMNP